jgi:hypothetical protein
MQADIILAMDLMLPMKKRGQGPENGSSNQEVTR